ncbi:sulfate transporter CysZ [Vibrio nigripulchritudo]|uniref:sulfate transporter CysZ n=1 Tax=Vibrio nigripulchritudo TaxID=28173 RepID=UPI0003B17CE8|nr:sulfate transporter CysZ [Vibrio nigripulchritudo]CCN71641.1 Protein cysZ [Vibrio nigripulchritudo SFn118]BCL68858.1 sulfate transporter CysZ [Vibrio nigripulchritudo]BDU30189.1 sulfate transporter CysZ [Vibrio nigripulchritudo]BDU36344.1 sulfate transporter CysZ [Vibrio nigripulchritudo]BDU42001.1 sulfate transporter CysZ [Vibrio nigripulchritudo]
MTTHHRSGIGYFFHGIELAFQPGIRRFVILPLLVNILLIGGAIYFLFSNLNQWIDAWLSYLPDMLSWLSYLLWPLVALAILATFTYLFSTIANFVAAPFNGLLAEQLEAKLTGKTLSDQSVMSLLKDVPRILGREWRKLMYYLPKALGLFILLLIPALGQTVGPILWFLFSAWMLAIQYCDYPFDNHKVTFQDMRNDLKQNQSTSYGFGFMVSLFTMIPILNLFVMPVAVCGATAMWVDKYRLQYVR